MRNSEGGGAWTDNEPTRPSTHQQPGATGAKGAGGMEGQAAVPVSGGGAWPGYSRRPSPTGVEGAGGTGGHGRASRRGAERSEDA